MPRKARCAIDLQKKETEKRYLNLFKSLYSDFPKGRVDDCESPDFLVHANSGTIGIEIEDYQADIQEGQQTKGSQVHKEERIREMFVTQAQKEFEAHNHKKLIVKVFWLDRTRVSTADTKRLAKTMADLIAKTDTPDLSDVWLEHRSLKDTSLRNFVQSIHISANRRISRGHWSSAQTAWLGTSAGQLQESISRKDKKLNSYLAKCDSAWLIIVSDSQHLYSTVDSSDTLVQHHYVTRFERVFLLITTPPSVITLVNHN